MMSRSIEMLTYQKDEMFLISEQRPFAYTMLETIGASAGLSDNDG